MTFVLLLLCLLGLEAGGPPSPPSPAPAPADAVRAARAAEDAAIAVVDARLSREPSVDRVRRWATATGGIGPAETQSLLRDGRLAGGLPWIRMRGRFIDADRKDFDEFALMADRERDATWTLEVSLDWDLAEAVAGQARFKSIREARSLVELQQAIAHRVNVAFHDRQRLLLEEAIAAAIGPEPVGRRAERLVRVRELDGELDALTGGRWRRALAALDDVELPGPLRVEPESPGLVADDRRRTP